MNSLKQQAQKAIALVTAAASSPQAESDGRQAPDTAAHGMARASSLSFAALIVGTIIAIISGGVGFRLQPAYEDAELRADPRWARPSGQPPL